MPRRAKAFQTLRSSRSAHALNANTLALAKLSSNEQVQLIKTRYVFTDSQSTGLLTTRLPVQNSKFAVGRRFRRSLPAFAIAVIASAACWLASQPSTEAEVSSEPERNSYNERLHSNDVTSGLCARENSKTFNFEGVKVVIVADACRTSVVTESEDGQTLTTRTLQK